MSRSVSKVMYEGLEEKNQYIGRDREKEIQKYKIIYIDNYLKMKCTDRRQIVHDKGELTKRIQSKGKFIERQKNF